MVSYYLGNFSCIERFLYYIQISSNLIREKLRKIVYFSTLLVAGSALGIYNQGGFGVAHVLAVLTLIALAGGYIMERYKWFGSFSKYFQALGYTSTLLFHMIPAITDFPPGCYGAAGGSYA